MKRLLPLLTILLLAAACSTGSSKINSKTKIVIQNQELAPLAELLQVHLETLSGNFLQISTEASGNDILLEISEDLEKGYQINTDKGFEIKGSDYSNLAFGVAELLGLPDIEIPSASSINRSAKYDYRAVMIDVARFWHPVETLEEIIDLLWFYQVPYMPLHLSDNRRFTFPLDQYPDLKTVLPNGDREYYTREELDHLVEYARVRGIAIIPEIDMPGHSAQLFTKYPDTFGTIDPKTGKAKYLHVVNIAKEECIEACREIIRELAEVFYTSPYIHFGGDECYFEELKKVPEYKPMCEKLGLEESLKGNPQELFCYFINEMNATVKSTGKKSIIWEGFHGTGAGKIVVDKDIDIIVWNGTYNHPQNLLDNGYRIANSTWVPWYMVGAMNLAPSPEIAFTWEINQWGHWNPAINEVEVNTKEGIFGAQISYWEQNYYMNVPVLRDRLPIFSNYLWGDQRWSSYEEAASETRRLDKIFSDLFHPIAYEVKGLANAADHTFTDAIEITPFRKSGNPSNTILKYCTSPKWGLPKKGEYQVCDGSFSIDESSIVSIALFSADNQQIGYTVQSYFQKVTPAYNYTMYGPAPMTGWESMPDFDTIPVIRKGIIGKMTPERLDIINGELFAKVKNFGHIDTRVNGQYNPYGMILEGSVIIPADGDYEFKVQTWDGLAELYIDGKPIVICEKTVNAPESKIVALKQGEFPVKIKYYYARIQNQLSIEYRAMVDAEYKPFEDLVGTLLP